MIFLITLINFFVLLKTYTQELKCNVMVYSQQIQTSNRHIFESMQKDIFEFINNRKWTDHVFSYDERIECSIILNLTEQLSTNEYKGNIQIQSIRPVYNTNYNSPILNFKDNDVQFEYVEHQQMDFNENTFSSNLTSLLAYYVYIILGYDYDSFSLYGGTPFFQKAEKIVQNAQNAKETGWKAFENPKNRYWLINDILNPKFQPIREFYYKFHRLGLDVMHDKQPEARQTILESLELLQKVYRDKPRHIMMPLQMVFDAKSDEFVQIFSEAYTEEKTRAFNILKEIDPSNINKYQKILKE